jgi:hypothetical protein
MALAAAALPSQNGKAQQQFKRAKKNSPRSSKDGRGRGPLRERKYLLNKKFLTGPASNLHIPNDSVALCLKQTFCDGYHSPMSASDAIRSKKSY